MVTEQGWQFSSQRNPRRTGKGGKINQKIRRIIQRIGNGIGKNQSPLGIGIANFNLEASARVDDIKRAH